MSAAILPKSTARVILHTTLGPIDIELYAKEIPLASKNFIALCMEGFYDQCPFHRVIKGFIAQTGAKNHETGADGECALPNRSTFENEFHSRIRFVKRGMVACAGQLGKNDSQFFITLDKCEQLNGKHTIFGAVVGDTYFNVLKMNDLEVDASTERPVHVPRIIRTEIVLNPFDDIVPRAKQPTAATSSAGTGAAAAAKAKPKPKKNLQLLSFADEADEEERQLQETVSVKSQHDVLTASASAASRAAQSKSAVAAEAMPAAARSDDIHAAKSSKKRSRESIDEEVDNRAESGRYSPVSDGADASETDADTEASLGPRGLAESEKSSSKRREDAVVPPSSKKSKTDVTASAKDYFEQQRQKYAKKRTVNEDDALAKVLGFTSRLASSSSSLAPVAEAKEVPKAAAASDEEGYIGEGDSTSWRSHALVFTKTREEREKMKAEEEYETMDGHSNYDETRHRHHREDSRSDRHAGREQHQHRGYGDDRHGSTRDSRDSKYRS